MREVILTATLVEETGPSDGPYTYAAVEFINAWLGSEGYGELHQVLHPKGAQHMSLDATWVMQTGNLDEEAFAQTVKKAPWEWPGQVQLFLRVEDDRGFREIKLWDAP